MGLLESKTKNALHLDVVVRYARRMGDKRFQTSLPRVWNRMSHSYRSTTIKTIKELWILCFVHRYKNVFPPKNTLIPVCRCFSHCTHPNKEVSRSCSRRSADAKDVFCG